MIPESQPGATTGASRDRPAGGVAPAERWRRLKELFHDAVEHERTAREAFLRERADDDESLIADVRRLLRSHDEATEGFLGGLPMPVGWGDDEPDLGGRQIGPYRVLERIGRGGMGSVWKATRDEDGKLVAVKLLRRSAHGALLAERLRSERRILAALEHDNIARLIDGGTTADGLPYLALEYVEGRPILEHCEPLELRARLHLFRTLCAAVDYAHQRLVVHRDIKPANVLVTPAGVPKLLDFGIAKLSSPDTGADAPTLTLLPAMTPEYASPEQVRGQAVGTATDVYALGLVLYELVTGRRAQVLTTRTPDEIVRTVCELEPARPSDAAPAPRARALRGDLDAIIMKALRKEPERRYGSARELSDDLRRHLEARPVSARGGEWSYRARRFARRNRGALVAGALVLASLLGGLVAAARQARLAEANRQRAERRLADVRKLAGSFLFEFHDAIQDLPGSTPARQLVVAKAREYLDSLAREPSADIALTQELAAAYLRVGDVQGYPWNANLGDTAGALASYGRAVELLDPLARAHPRDAELSAGLARALERLGTIRAASGDGARALEQLHRAQALLEAALMARPDERALLRDLHVVHMRQGDVLRRRGAHDAALPHYEQCQRLTERALALAPTDARARRDVSVALSRVAEAVGVRDPARALELHRRVLAIDEQAASQASDSAQARRDLAIDRENIAQVLAALRRFDEALEEQQRALAIRLELARADPANEQARQDVSVSHAQIGDLLRDQGRLEPALVSYRRALEIDARIVARDPRNETARDYLGSSHLNVADTLVRLGRLGPALEEFRRALQIYEALGGGEQADPELRRSLADACARAAEAHLARAASGPADAARRDRRRACELDARAAQVWEALTARGEALAPEDARRAAAIHARLGACSSAR